MTTKIAPWGNSLGIRIPKILLDVLGLSAGSEIILKEKDGQIVLEPVEKEPTLAELLKGVKSKNRHPEYWTDIPQGKEIW